MKRHVLGSPWTERGIQPRVMLLVGIGTLAAIGTLGAVAWHRVDELTGEMLRERTLLAVSAAERVDTLLGADMQALQGIASTLSLGIPEEAADGVAPAAVREAYLRARLLQRAMVFGPDGRLLWEHPAGGPPAAGIAALPEFQRALTERRPQVSGLVPGHGEPPLAYVLLPSTDPGGRVVALVGGEIDLTLQRGVALVGNLDVGVGASVDVADSRGFILASSDRSRRFEREPEAAELEVRGRARRPLVTTVGQAGARTVVALAPVASAPWTVVVRQAEREALASQIELQRTILWLAPTLLAITLVFAAGAARSVRRSLAVLSRAAARIAHGELAEPIPKLAEDEIGALGRALDEMRVALKGLIDRVEQANQALERRVVERTAELASANAQLREREVALNELLRKVITAQEDERKRIARELHDETAQTLSALAMNLETASSSFPSDAARARLSDAKALTVRALEELQRLMLDLRPSVLDDLGLLSAIRWSAERSLERRGIAVRCDLADDAEVEGRLPLEVETALFRVVQEAITNIARHARAESVLIQADVTGGCLVIEIEDDGEGFDLASLPPPGARQRGLGLLGMRERVELIGGSITIDSAPGQGTRLVVTVPLSPESRHG